MVCVCVCVCVWWEGEGEGEGVGEVVWVAEEERREGGRLRRFRKEG